MDGCRKPSGKSSRPGRMPEITRNYWPPVCVVWWCWQSRRAGALSGRLATFKVRALLPWPRTAARRTAGQALLELLLYSADECDGAGPPLPSLLADAHHVYPVAEIADVNRPVEKKGRLLLRARGGTRSPSVAASADQGHTAPKKNPKQTRVRIKNGKYACQGQNLF